MAAAAHPAVLRTAAAVLTEVHPAALHMAVGGLPVAHSEEHHKAAAVELQPVAAEAGLTGAAGTAEAAGLMPD